MNLIKDFTLRRYMAGPQRGQDSMWSFRFGKCDEFEMAIKAVKSLPLSERHYYGDRDHLWEVKPSQRAQQALARAFDNFTACLETARSQLPLF